MEQMKDDDDDLIQGPDLTLDEDPIRVKAFMTNLESVDLFKPPQEQIQQEGVDKEDLDIPAGDIDNKQTKHQISVPPVSAVSNHSNRLCYDCPGDFDCIFAGKRRTQI